MDPITIDNYLRHDACPVCRSPEIDAVGKLDYRGLTRFSTCMIELGRIPEFWRCRSCGSGFVQNAIDEPTTQHLYSMGTAGNAGPPSRLNETRRVSSCAGFRHCSGLGCGFWM